MYSFFIILTYKRGSVMIIVYILRKSKHIRKYITSNISNELVRCGINVSCKRWRGAGGGAGRSRVQSPAAFLRSLPPSLPPAGASAAFPPGYNTI